MGTSLVFSIQTIRKRLASTGMPAPNLGDVEACMHKSQAPGPSRLAGSRDGDTTPGLSRPFVHGGTDGFDAQCSCSIPTPEESYRTIPR